MKKKSHLNGAGDATLHCPQCGSEIVPVERIETKISNSERFRRFECSNKYCDHKESVRCGGHNLKRQEQKVISAAKYDKLTRGNNIY